MKTNKIFLFTVLALSMVTGCMVDKLPGGEETQKENPYRGTIVGFWKLQNVDYNYDNEEKKSVEFNDSPVVYEFTDKNKLIVTGSETILPDNIVIAEGEHDCEYQKPNVGILAMPAPNFRIDQGEPLFCLALENDYIMSLGGEKLDRQSGEIFRWEKIFIKQD